MSRVYQGHQPTATAAMASVSEGSNSPRIAIASTSDGTARKMSVIRMMTSSQLPAEVARDQAETHTEGNGDQEDHDSQHQRDAVPEDDPAQDVAAEVVGSEPVLEGWRLVAPDDVDELAGGFGMRRHERGRDRDRDDRRDNQESDHGKRVAGELVPRPGSWQEPARHVRPSIRMRGFT